MRIGRASLAVGVGRDLVLAIVVFAAVLVVLLSVQLGSTERELRERSLDEAAQYLARHLVPAPDGKLRLPVPPGSSWSIFGYPAVVLGADGAVLYRRPPPLAPQVIALLAERRLAAARRPHVLGGIRFFKAKLGEQDITAAALGVGTGPQERIVIVFKDEKAPDVLVDDVVRAFPYRSLRVMLPIVALLLLVGGGLLWRRMRPIALVSEIAATIGPHTPNRRLPEQRLPAELVPIVRAVNGAFDRLDRAAEAQREFLRRAAHQLRTPMTVASARAALLGDSETAAQLRGDIGELARIVGQLLQLNEIGALPGPAASVADLDAVGEAVGAELAAQAAGSGRRIDLARPGGAVLVGGDPNVIEVAVRNLVENALHHSPAGHPVEIRIAADGEIAVADRGPGVEAAQREQIFEPFWSGNAQGAHAGLGLTIVRRIAELYGARLSVGSNPGGGAVFALRFPLAATADPEAARRSIPASLAQRRRRAALQQPAGAVD